MTYVWQGGRSARSDVARKAKTVYMRDQYADWLPQKNLLDIEHIDVPEDNILCSHVYGKPVWFGTGQASVTRKVAKLGSEVLASNFSANEIRKMKNIYVDLGGTNNQRYAGVTCFLAQGVAVLIASKYINDVDKFESVLTHEFIHIRRSFDKEYTLDRNDDEKRTELERIARVARPWKGVHGYYAYAKKTEEDSLTMEDRMIKDREGMTGSMTKKLKGVEAVRRAREYYPQSEIAKVHFSPPEKIDRYFDVTAPIGHYSVHVWYPEAPRYRKVNYDLKSIFGDDARIFEWNNGKRARLN
jgi:hypothetical protein